VQPKLNNLREVQRALTRLYPRMLQDAGISGQTVMQFVITEQGTVDPSTVEVVQSSHDPFREASTRVVETFKFDPGRYQGRNVRVLIRMPITWQAQ
jgi:TonB family protein